MCENRIIASKYKIISLESKYKITNSLLPSGKCGSGIIRIPTNRFAKLEPDSEFEDPVEKMSQQRSPYVVVHDSVPTLWEMALKAIPLEELSNELAQKIDAQYCTNVRQHLSLTQSILVKLTDPTNLQRKYLTYAQQVVFNQSQKFQRRYDNLVLSTPFGRLNANVNFGYQCETDSKAIMPIREGDFFLHRLDVHEFIKVESWVCFAHNESEHFGKGNPRMITNYYYIPSGRGEKIDRQRKITQRGIWTLLDPSNPYNWKLSGEVEIVNHDKKIKLKGTRDYKETNHGRKVSFIRTNEVAWKDDNGDYTIVGKSDDDGKLCGSVTKTSIFKDRTLIETGTLLKENSTHTLPENWFLSGKGEQIVLCDDKEVSRESGIWELVNSDCPTAGVMLKSLTEEPSAKKTKIIKL